MKRIWLFIAAVLLLSGWATQASAQSCSATASSVSFGSVNLLDRSVSNTSGTINVRCTWPQDTQTPNVLVCLNLGGTGPRYLVNGINRMQYELYQDPAYSQLWGSVATGTQPVSLILSRPAHGMTALGTVTIYGQIAPNQSTVPTIRNGNTPYTQSFSGSQATLTYGFYQASSPSCASLVSTQKSLAFNVSATVINHCNISATNIHFSSSSTLSRALKANGAITAQCTRGDAYRISLNGGLNGNAMQRYMKQSGNGKTVNYQLYLDGGYTRVWGDGSAGTVMATGTGSGERQVLNVYGLVPAQATPAPGNYVDTITATISF